MFQQMLKAVKRMIKILREILGDMMGEPIDNIEEDFLK